MNSFTSLIQAPETQPTAVTTVRLFKQYLRVPFIVMAVLETCILIGSVYLGASLRYLGDFGAVDTYVGDLGPRALVYAAVMIVALGSMGLYQVGQSTRMRDMLKRLALAVGMGWLGLSLLYYLYPTVYSGRGIIALSAVISLALLALIRPAFYRLLSDKSLKRRVLVLGTNEPAAELLARSPEFAGHGFDLAGFVVSRDGNAVDKANTVSIAEGSLLGECQRLRIREIVVAADKPTDSVRTDELLECKLAGISVHSLLSFYEREDGRVHLDLLYPEWLIYCDGCDQTAVRQGVKRTFDIVVSLLALVFSFPLMILAVLAIKLEDGLRAPVLYRQVRVGEHGNPFTLMKFRSMGTDAEKDGKARWASEDDDRTTRVGRVIRKIRIDELPQIFNVLRGEMSFIGPRPERPQFVEDLAEKIPYYAERHCVKPGITGWAQVRYPYGANLDDARRKLEYDLYYVKNHALMFDLYIILLTAETVIFGRGR